MPIEAGGRSFNIVPIAAGVGLSMRDAAAITYVCTGNDTFTITVSPTFGGAYATPGSIIVNKYTCTATNGTAKWVAATQAAANTVVIASGSVLFVVRNTMLTDPAVYVKVAASAAGLVTAVLGDLNVERRLSNIVAPST